MGRRVGAALSTLVLAMLSPTAAAAPVVLPAHDFSFDPTVGTTILAPLACAILAPGGQTELRWSDPVTAPFIMPAAPALFRPTYLIHGIVGPVAEYHLEHFSTGYDINDSAGATCYLSQRAYFRFDPQGVALGPAQGETFTWESPVLAAYASAGGTLNPSSACLMNQWVDVPGMGWTMNPLAALSASATFSGGVISCSISFAFIPGVPGIVYEFNVGVEVAGGVAFTPPTEMDAWVTWSDGIHSDTGYMELAIL